jgi:hypothetical protein
MYNLTLTVKDLAGDLEVDLRVPLEDRATVDDLVVQVVALLKWPRLDSAGRAVSYVALAEESGQPLAGNRTLEDCGIFHSATVLLAPSARGA